jgi:hypothetical protein
MTDPYQLSTEILITKSKKRKKSRQNCCKTQRNLTKQWQWSQTTYLITFTPGLNKWWEFCKMMTGGDDRRWKMVIILVFRKQLFKKASATPSPGKPTIRLLCRTVTVPNLKNRRSQILLNQNRGGGGGSQVVSFFSRFHPSVSQSFKERCKKNIKRNSCSRSHQGKCPHGPHPSRPIHLEILPLLSLCVALIFLSRK